MSENFNKLKKFFTRYTAIKCAVFGVSLGLFVVGVVLLALKLSAINISPAYYVLMGVGTAGIAGTALFFVFRPADKKLARRLDIEYGLNEKVQTMLAYSESDSDLAVIQRETTDSKLGFIKVKLRITEILKQIVAPVLACAMIVTAVVIPAKQVPAQGEEPPFVGTPDQFASLRQLIKDVNDSYMESGLKASVAAVLEGLLESVDKEDCTMTNSQMVTAVLSTVSVIDGLIAQEDSYIVLGSELKKSENLQVLGNAILTGVVSYRDGTRLRKLERVNEKYDKVEESINSKLTESFETINALFAEVDGPDMQKAILSFCEIFDGLLVNTGYAESSDALYNALATLSAGIKKNITGFNASALRNQIAEACNKFTETGTVVLGIQSYNCMMDEFIRECLSLIFRISLSDFPSNENVIYVDKESGDTTEPDDGKNNNGSGPGDEEILYGGKEIIYYPADNEYVLYGDVLQEYRKAVMDHLDSDNVPEEYIQFILNYFDILYQGLEKEKN